MNGKSRGSRESAPRRSFRNKVEAFEALVDGGVWDPCSIPATLEEVVKWHEPERGIIRWSSYSVAAPNGNNADLRRRLDAALSVLRKKPPAESRRAEPRTAEHLRALREMQALATQNAELHLENQRLKTSLDLIHSQMRILVDREKELVTMVNDIMPLGRKVRRVSPEEFR